MRSYRCSRGQMLWVAGLVAIAACLTTGSARAGLILVTTRAGLGGTDTIDWGQLGGTGTGITNPVLVTSTGGVPATVSQATTGAERVNQGNGWSGNFAPGDRVYWTTGNGGAGPVTLNFGTRNFSGVGAQIEADFFGPFTARLEAFNASGASLGFVTESGVSNSNNDNSAIFLGVLSTGNDIAKVVFSLTAAASSPTDFALNDVSLAPAPAPVPSTPEPSSLDLLALGGVALAGWRRWKKRSVSV